MITLKEVPTTQQEAVLWHLNKYGSITSWEAIKEYGATRLSAIIYNLRDEGHIIKSESETTKNRFNRTVTFVVYKYIEQDSLPF